MAKYLYNVDGRNQPVTLTIPVAASQTIEEGDLVEMDGSGKGQPAQAESDTIIGIAQYGIETGASVDESDAIAVTSVEGIAFQIDVTGSDITDSDLFGDTVFDLSDEKTLNQADTTNGMLKVLAYDNDNNTADVVVQRANYALA